MKAIEIFFLNNAGICVKSDFEAIGYDCRYPNVDSAIIDIYRRFGKPSYIDGREMHYDLGDKGDIFVTFIDDYLSKGDIVRSDNHNSPIRFDRAIIIETFWDSFYKYYRVNIGGTIKILRTEDLLKI